MALKDEYKALTFINLPFTEFGYTPGQMIPLSAFEEYVDAANRDIDDRSHVDPDATPPVTTEFVISEFLQYGSISEDPDAELNPAHIQPDPTQPTLASLVAQAAQMVETLTAAGQEIPAGLQALADTDAVDVGSADNGQGVEDNHVS